MAARIGRGPRAVARNQPRRGSGGRTRGVSGGKPTPEGLGGNSTRRGLAVASPRRRDEPALAVGRHRDAGGGEGVAVPEFAGDLLVLLVEGFAVVRELAATDLVARARAHLGEPVGIGERLARGRDDVGVAAR